MNPIYIEETQSKAERYLELSRRTTQKIISTRLTFQHHSDILCKENFVKPFTFTSKGYFYVLIKNHLKVYPINIEETEKNQKGN